MSFWTDPWGSVKGTLDDTWNSIKNNPTGVLVDIGLVAMGVPPIYAAAAGGAAGAAAAGGNTTSILEGAAIGGAAAYVGGVAGQSAAGAATSAGASVTGAAIAGGATAGIAAGWTAAELSGGNAGKTMASGALVGGITGYYVSPSTQSTTYSFDDGSTLTVDSTGNPINFTNAGSVSAPVSSINPPPGADTLPQGVTQLGNGTYVNGQGMQVDPSTGALTPQSMSSLSQTTIDGVNLAYDQTSGQVYNSDGTLNGALKYNSDTGAINNNTNGQSTVVNQAAAILNGSETQPTIQGTNTNLNTLPAMDLPDGTTLHYNPNTGTTYNSDGTVNTNYTEQGGIGGNFVSTQPAPTPGTTATTTSTPASTPTTPGTTATATTTTPAAPIAPTPPPPPVTQTLANGDIYTPSTGAITSPNGNFVYQVPSGTTIQYTSSDGTNTQIALSNGSIVNYNSTNGTSTNSIPVKLPDGTVGQWDPITQQVYNSDGTLNATETIAGLNPYNASQIEGAQTASTNPGAGLNSINNQPPATGTPNMANLQSLKVGTPVYDARGDFTGYAIPGSDGGIALGPNPPTTTPTPVAPVTPAQPVQPTTPTSVTPVVAPVVPTTPTTTPTVNNNVTPTQTTSNVQPVVSPVVPITTVASTNTTPVTTTGNVAIATSGTTGNVSTTGTSNANVPLSNLANYSSNTALSTVANVDLTANVAGNTTSNVANPDQPTPPDQTTVVPVIPPPVTYNGNTYTDNGYTYQAPNVTKLQIANGLNPGWIAPTQYYANANPQQANFYWGMHQFQGGNTFDSSAYNTVPNAPVQPYGPNTANVVYQATPQNVLDILKGIYPSLGTISPSGPVAPSTSSSSDTTTNTVH